METLGLKLAIGRLETLSLEEKVKLSKTLRDLSEWEKLTKKDVEDLLKRPFRAKVDFSFLARQSRKDMELLQKVGYFLWQWGALDYPAALAEIPDPPFLLWGRGQVPDLNRPWVSVIGTRNPCEQARMAAFELARDLSHKGITVVSGLARGIDAAAHRGVVSKGDAQRAVAVLGQGIDWVFPASSRSLARRMVNSGGCLLSEYGPGSGAVAYHFIARNRIISGLSRTVVVVQAPLRSGALITASFALDQGRDVAVHSKGLNGPQGAGGLSWACQGAYVLSSAEDLIDFWLSGKVGSSCKQQELPWNDVLIRNET